MPSLLKMSLAHFGLIKGLVNKTHSIYIKNLRKWASSATVTLGRLYNVWLASSARTKCPIP